MTKIGHTLLLLLLSLYHCYAFYFYSSPMPVVELEREVKLSVDVSKMKLVMPHDAHVQNQIVNGMRDIMMGSDYDAVLNVPVSHCDNYFSTLGDNITSAISVEVTMDRFFTVGNDRLMFDTGQGSFRRVYEGVKYRLPTYMPDLMVGGQKIKHVNNKYIGETTHMVLGGNKNNSPGFEKKCLFAPWLSSVRVVRNGVEVPKSDQGTLFCIDPSKDSITITDTSKNFNWVNFIKEDNGTLFVAAEQPGKSGCEPEIEPADQYFKVTRAMSESDLDEIIKAANLGKVAVNKGNVTRIRREVKILKDESLMCKWFGICDDQVVNVNNDEHMGNVGTFCASYPAHEICKPVITRKRRSWACGKPVITSVYTFFTGDSCNEDIADKVQAINSILITSILRLNEGLNKVRLNQMVFQWRTNILFGMHKQQVKRNKWQLSWNKIATHRLNDIEDSLIRLQKETSQFVKYSSHELNSLRKMTTVNKVLIQFKTAIDKHKSMLGKHSADDTHVMFSKREGRTIDIFFMRVSHRHVKSVLGMTVNCNTVGTCTGGYKPHYMGVCFRDTSSGLIKYLRNYESYNGIVAAASEPLDEDNFSIRVPCGPYSTDSDGIHALSPLYVHLKDGTTYFVPTGTTYMPSCSNPPMNITNSPCRSSPSMTFERIDTSSMNTLVMLSDEIRLFSVTDISFSNSSRSTMETLDKQMNNDQLRSENLVKNVTKKWEQQNLDLYSRFNRLKSINGDIIDAMDEARKINKKLSEDLGDRAPWWLVIFATCLGGSSLLMNIITIVILCQCMKPASACSVQSIVDEDDTSKAFLMASYVIYGMTSDIVSDCASSLACRLKTALKDMLKSYNGHSVSSGSKINTRCAIQGKFSMVVEFIDGIIQRDSRDCFKPLSRFKNEKFLMINHGFLGSLCEECDLIHGPGRTEKINKIVKEFHETILPDLPEPPASDADPDHNFSSKKKCVEDGSMAPLFRKFRRSMVCSLKDSKEYVNRHQMHTNVEVKDNFIPWMINTKSLIASVNYFAELIMILTTNDMEHISSPTGDGFDKFRLAKSDYRAGPSLFNSYSWMFLVSLCPTVSAGSGIGSNEGKICLTLMVTVILSLTLLISRICADPIEDLETIRSTDDYDEMKLCYVRYIVTIMFKLLMVNKSKMSKCVMSLVHNSVCDEFSLDLERNPPLSDKPCLQQKELSLTDLFKAMDDSGFSDTLPVNRTLKESSDEARFSAVYKYLGELKECVYVNKMTGVNPVTMIDSVLSKMNSNEDTHTSGDDINGYILNQQAESAAKKLCACESMRGLTSSTKGANALLESNGMTEQCVSIPPCNSALCLSLVVDQISESLCMLMLNPGNKVKVNGKKGALSETRRLSKFYHERESHKEEDRCRLMVGLRSSGLVGSSHHSMIQSFLCLVLMFSTRASASFLCPDGVFSTSFLEGSVIATTVFAMVLTVISQYQLTSHSKEIMKINAGLAALITMARSTRAAGVGNNTSIERYVIKCNTKDVIMYSCTLILVLNSLLYTARKAAEFRHERLNKFDSDAGRMFWGLMTSSNIGQSRASGMNESFSGSDYVLYFFLFMSVLIMFSLNISPIARGCRCVMRRLTSFYHGFEWSMDTSKLAHIVVSFILAGKIQYVSSMSQNQTLSDVDDMKPHANTFVYFLNIFMMLVLCLSIMILTVSSISETSINNMCCRISVVTLLISIVYLNMSYSMQSNGVLAFFKWECISTCVISFSEIVLLYVCNLFALLGLVLMFLYDKQLGFIASAASLPAGVKADGLTKSESVVVVLCVVCVSLIILFFVLRESMSRIKMMSYKKELDSMWKANCESDTRWYNIDAIEGSSEMNPSMVKFVCDGHSSDLKFISFAASMCSDHKLMVCVTQMTKSESTLCETALYEKSSLLWAKCRTLKECFDLDGIVKLKSLSDGVCEFESDESIIKLNQWVSDYWTCISRIVRNVVSIKTLTRTSSLLKSGASVIILSSLPCANAQKLGRIDHSLSLAAITLNLFLITCGVYILARKGKTLSQTGIFNIISFEIAAMYMLFGGGAMGALTTMFVSYTQKSNIMKILMAIVTVFISCKVGAAPLTVKTQPVVRNIDPITQPPVDLTQLNVGIWLLVSLTIVLFMWNMFMTCSTRNMLHDVLSELTESRFEDCNDCHKDMTGVSHDQRSRYRKCIKLILRSRYHNGDTLEMLKDRELLIGMVPDGMESEIEKLKISHCVFMLSQKGFDIVINKELKSDFVKTEALVEIDDGTTKLRFKDDTFRFVYTDITSAILNISGTAVECEVNESTLPTMTRSESVRFKAKKGMRSAAYALSGDAVRSMVRKPRLVFANSAMSD